MNGRLDKFGQWLSMGDRVRCPTQRQGTVRGFAQSAGRQRVIVEYDGSDLGRVTLLPRLLEKVSAQKRCLVVCKGRRVLEEQGNVFTQQIALEGSVEQLASAGAHASMNEPPVVSSASGSRVRPHRP